MKVPWKIAIVVVAILLAVMVCHNTRPRRLTAQDTLLATPVPAELATHEAVTGRSEQTSSLCVVSNVPLAGGFADADYRKREVTRLARQGAAERRTAVERAEHEGWDPRTETDSESSRLIAIRDGRPYVLITHNRNAGISIAVDRVRNTDPFNLSGSGRTIGLWDAGHALSTHQELAGRVSVMDGSPYWQGHSTHVGGTIGASGVVAMAIGMAPAVRIDSYDWNGDLSEMASRAMAVPGETNKIQVSNHSYGPSTGWVGLSPLRWYGTWGAQESDGFGSYETDAAELDTICWNAPYYQPFMSSGNDRSDSVPAEGEFFSYYDSGWRQTAYNSSIHPHADNWDNGGYDTIPTRGSAKNIVTVGCVNDAVSGGTRFLAGATMTSYSSWGPTDDGRVKPDLVANGDMV
ncbi:MAG: S8 family serine peptidase, partial [bacterium]